MFNDEHSEAVVEYDDITNSYSDEQDDQLHDESGAVVDGKDPATGIENLNEIPKALRWWNISACLFQFGQAGALLYLATQADFSWPLYVNFPATFDETAQEGFGVPAPKEVASYSVTWLSGVFLGFSGLDHFLVSFPWINQKYNYYIERYQNPFRWTEYAFSASLMRVMIAQLSGITDLHSLFMIFILTATTMILGSCHESVNAVARADGYRQNWFPFLTAWITHLASWSVIFCYFFVSVSRADPPNFVWAIIIVLFVLDLTFALLFYMQWGKVWIFRDYVKGEIGFIVLSFTSKALLAWINYVSTIAKIDCLHVALMPRRTKTHAHPSTLQFGGTRP